MLKKDKKNKKSERPHGNGSDGRLSGTAAQIDGGLQSHTVPRPLQQDPVSPFMLNLWEDFTQSKGFTKIRASHGDWTRSFLEYMGRIMDPLHRHNLMPRPKCMLQAPFCAKPFEGEALNFLMGRKNRAIKKAAADANKMLRHQSTEDSLDLAGNSPEHEGLDATEDDAKVSLDPLPTHTASDEELKMEDSSALFQCQNLIMQVYFNEK